MDDQSEEVRRVREAIAAVAVEAAPAERARRLDEAMEAARLEWRRRRREAMQEMKDGGMTLREIAKELGISFGRVRQILADDPDATPSEE
ncbi:helix-turn-helix domain-containing protein [Streptomyces lincolnensis]|uniref:sigma factor-like helix-turn-helix DNA-binding protein n=1 Tax=Streptomyces lincolnensis TaxID=1915 RepID=UPI001E44F133|nr:sigma factor-like helix-turn-helix DNA-binding protein [Streptomyces lincolnensis]MCD7440260.1 helix-turn-helix domain-containing protein [Streptomyces lincolnensis]